MNPLRPTASRPFSGGARPGLRRTTATKTRGKPAPLNGGRAHPGVIAALVALVCIFTSAAALIAQPQAAVRFTALDIILTTDVPLAAYQIEFQASSPDVLLVGVEGGETEAFAEPPYYDPAALHPTMGEGRIVLAAYSLSADLPVGATRVACLHLQIPADYELQPILKVIIAADTNGEAIEATIEAQEGGA
jgi:hypothetical protein